MVQPWRVDLLGQLRLQRDGIVITHFYSHPVGALLACLALFPSRLHSREELVEQIWPGADPSSARRRLTQALVWLRDHLEPGEADTNQILIADRTTIRLNPNSIQIDTAQFLQALESARASAGISEQRTGLKEAVALYTGELLPGFYESWALDERRRLHAAYVNALCDLSRLCRQDFASADNLVAAEAFARQAVTADPTLEETHLALMNALIASGRNAAALRQFHELKRILAANFDEEPSAEATALAARIRSESLATDSRLPEPTNSLSTLPRLRWPALPTSMTEFFGREEEIDRIDALLIGGARLVTLLGTGGSGKTRLSLETARRLMSRFGNAVAFVPLADISDARLLLGAAADTLELGRNPQVEPLDQIREALSSLPGLLIVLDNLEHIAETAALPIRLLLDALPNLSVLVTSRQCLGLYGERLIDIRPLPVPTEDAPPLDQASRSPSVRLFVDRAQSTRSSFRLTEENAPTIVALCKRLDGIPLALELCAAWAGTLAPAEMLVQLENRFELLISRRADIPARHRTLYAAIDGSCAKLPPELKTLFLRMAVFRGGWNLKAAQGIAASDLRTADLLAQISQLRERSLIEAEESTVSPDAPMRYRMLESLREYSAAQWTGKEERELRNAHAAYYLAFAEETERDIDSPREAQSLKDVETELDNLRAALQRYFDLRSVESGLRLAVALSHFYEMQGYLAEGVDWLARFLTLAESSATSPSLHARALAVQSDLTKSLGEFGESLKIAEKALLLAEKAGDDPQKAIILSILGRCLYRLGDIEASKQRHEQSLTLARSLGRNSMVASNLVGLANLHYQCKEWTDARMLYGEALEIYGQTGHQRNSANLLNNLGLIARHQGRYQEATAYLENALRIRRQMSDKSGTAIALVNLGTIARLKGSPTDFAAAKPLLQESLLISTEVGNKYVIAWGLKETGHLAFAEGLYVRSIRLLAAADALREALQTTFKPADDLEHDVAASRQALGEEAAAAAWNAGLQLPLDQAIREAISE